MMDRADKVPVKRAAQGDTEAGPCKKATISGPAGQEIVSGPTGQEIVQIMNYWQHVMSFRR